MSSLRGPERNGELVVNLARRARTRSVPARPPGGRAASCGCSGRAIARSAGAPIDDHAWLGRYPGRPRARVSARFVPRPPRSTAPPSTEAERARRPMSRVHARTRERQCRRESCAVLWCRRHGERPAMGCHDLLSDEEPQAETGRFGFLLSAEERIEQMRKELCWDGIPPVVDVQDRFGGDGTEAHGHGRLWAVLKRVANGRCCRRFAPGRRAGPRSGIHRRRAGVDTRSRRGFYLLSPPTKRCERAPGRHDEVRGQCFPGRATPPRSGP